MSGWIEANTPSSSDGSFDKWRLDVGRMYDELEKRTYELIQKVAPSEIGSLYR